VSAQAGVAELPGGTPAQPASAAGPAPVRIVVGYGFWIFLLSDIILFSALFATYAVLHGQTAGGPSGHELFELRNAGIETVVLLLSSYTCGLAVLSMERRRLSAFYLCCALTFVLGATFLGLEIREFVGLLERGAGPSRSAFLSAFFSLVGLHGTHVSVVLLWLIFLAAQTARRGALDFVRRRLLCFSLFWHALDIIWVALLTLVYLMGAR
jgi:cytochrome o ubiquinol oxidase subunit III